jgi:hypothetical protein
MGNFSWQINHLNGRTTHALNAALKSNGWLVLPKTQVVIMFAFSIAGTAITEQHTSLAVSQQRRLVSSLNHWQQTGNRRFVRFAAKKEQKIIIGRRMLYLVVSQNHGLSLTFVKNVIPGGIKSLRQTSNMKTRHNE